MSAHLLTDKSFIINYLKTNNLYTKKSYGQNFVIDENLISTLLGSANVNSGDVVLEIGPGIGSLTERLLEAGAEVVCVELDPRFASLLKHHFQDKPGFHLIEGDFLKRDVYGRVSDFISQINKVPKVVSNLPYYITSPIIVKLLQSDKKFDRITLTIQKEVAQRIVAPEGIKQYSAISVFVKYYADAFIEDIFAPSSFFPSPQVFSAVISLVPYEKKVYEIEKPEFFHHFVKLCFTERRKMLKNSIYRAMKSMQADLSAEDVDNILDELEIPGDVRPETLDIDQFLRISGRFLTVFPELKEKF